MEGTHFWPQLLDDLRLPSRKNGENYYLRVRRMALKALDVVPDNIRNVRTRCSVSMHKTLDCGAVGGQGIAHDNDFYWPRCCHDSGGGEETRAEKRRETAEENGDPGYTTIVIRTVRTVRTRDKNVFVQIVDLDSSRGS